MGGEFFGHLKDTKWLEWKGWFCACCCPGYVFGKVAYDKIQDDSYRLPYVCCPCVGAFWYMKAMERLPDPCLNRILAYFWMALCPLCAVYVSRCRRRNRPICRIQCVVQPNEKGHMYRQELDPPTHSSAL